MKINKPIDFFASAQLWVDKRNAVSGINELLAMQVKKRLLMIKNKRKYFISLTIIVILETITYFLLPQTRYDIWNHIASNFSIIPIYYYITLLLFFVFFIIYMALKKNNNLEIPLLLIFTVLIHITYLMWSLDCSCGNP